MLVSIVQGNAGWRFKTEEWYYESTFIHDNSVELEFVKISGNICKRKFRLGKDTNVIDFKAAMVSGAKAITIILDKVETRLGSTFTVGNVFVDL